MGPEGGKEPGEYSALPDSDLPFLFFQDAEEMCVVMISSFPEAGLSLEEIRNLTKPFGKVKDILIVSSHKKVLNNL